MKAESLQRIFHF